MREAIASSQPGLGDLVLRLDDGAPPADRLRCLSGSAPGSTASTDLASVLVAGTLHCAEATDAHSLLERFTAEGTECLRLLRGAFALAIWEAKTGSLYLVRDPLGTTPLFYARAGRDLVAGTSLRAVVAQQGVSSSLSVPALADHICHRWPDPGETFYEAVRRVPPGHFVRAHEGRIEVQRYWHPAPPGEHVRWIDFKAEDFDELMDQAVARALGDGRAGIYLSGGLDSVSVAAVASDQAARGAAAPPLALSLIFPAGGANEEPIQRAIASRLGLEHRLLPFETALGGRDLLGAALAASGRGDGPVMNVWYPAYRSLALEALDSGCTVAVTGGGGDEWLGVSPLLAADLMRRGDLIGLARLWHQTTRSFRLSRTASLRSVLWTFGAKPILADLAERYTPAVIAGYRVRRREGLAPAWVAPDAHVRAALSDRLRRTPPPRGHESFYLREGHLSLDHALISMEMEELYDNGRDTGLPVRMPFWDADLVDFLYRTPPETLTEGGRSKGLVRQMLARRFPGFEFERQRKVLATSLFADLIEQQFEAAWHTLGGLEALGRLGIVDEWALHSDVADIFRQRKHREIGRLWNVLSLEAWVRGQQEGR